MLDHSQTVAITEMTDFDGPRPLKNTEEKMADLHELLAENASDIECTLYVSPRI
jgi:hypothetical protein